MKAALGLALSLASMALGGSVTPVQKAVQMLEDMVVKAKKSKHEENVQFAGFSEFCKNTQASKAQDIKDAESQMGMLSADIEKADSEAKRLGTEIDGHNDDITGWEQDMKDSTKVRDSERATYLETHKDYMESIEAIKQAMAMLKQQNFDRKAKMLLQKVSSIKRIPEDTRNQIQSFVQQSEDPDPDANLGFEATAYQFQSGQIITMLEKLQAEFKDELNKLEKAEVARRQTYTLLQQDLTDSKKDGGVSIEDKTKTQFAEKKSSIDKTSDLKEVTDLHGSDTKYLSDLTTLCDTKKTEFEARTKLRDEEIEAIEKAVEILSGDDVSGNAEKHLPTLLQTRKGSSLAQLRSSTASSPQQRSVVEFLRSESARLSSHALSTLAMEAAADPFKKIKQLISELVERLMTEATNEATHKGWCDKELGQNKHTRESKSAEADTLTATIEGLESDISKLAKKIKTTTAELSKLEADVAEYTDKRGKEKATNAEAVKDATAGEAAITNAVKVLKEFYDKAAKATSFEQKAANAQPGQPEVPEIFDGAYKGQQANTGGVLGMLDVIASDFKRLRVDTNAAESAAQSEYDEFMSDSAQSKASLDVDLKHAKTNKLAKEGELGDAKESLSVAQSTLKSALEYFDKLKPTCMAEPMSYADRKARREDELESLKKALELLSADNLPSA